MSVFEIVIIVLACSVPMIAFLFILPKFKKKEKIKPVEQTKTMADIKQEETKPEIVKEELTKQKELIDDFSSNEIQSYIDFKKKNLTKPKRVEMPKDFNDVTLPYIPRRKKNIKKPQSVAEEINSLSPELKILMISGVLEPKNFDKF